MAANAIEPRRFNLGNNLPEAAASSVKEERIPAKFWLNIGYEVEVTGSDGTTETRFVSLPMGIALDTQQHKKPGKITTETGQLISAGNDLLDDLIKAAQAIPGGATQIVNLQVQIRHVAEPTVLASSENPFSPGAVKLNLLG